PPFRPRAPSRPFVFLRVPSCSFIPSRRGTVACGPRRVFTGFPVAVPRGGGAAPPTAFGSSAAHAPHRPEVHRRRGRSACGSRTPFPLNVPDRGMKAGDGGLAACVIGGTRGGFRSVDDQTGGEDVAFGVDMHAVAQH